MNKKILIGSIIALCILISISFTSVVGYRSVVSDVNVSPLFNIRSSRAIDEENRDFSCEYVGKGEESVLSIPKRIERLKLAQMVIDIIGRMDSKTYNKFIKTAINHLKQNNIDNHEPMKQINDKIFHKIENDYMGETFEPSYCWSMCYTAICGCLTFERIRCIIVVIIALPIIILDIITLLLLELFPTVFTEC